MNDLLTYVTENLGAGAIESSSKLDGLICPLHTFNGALHVLVKFMSANLILWPLYTVTLLTEICAKTLDLSM